MDKPIIFFPESVLKELRSMPEDVRDQVGYALHQVQQGTTPRSATKMSGKLKEVMEVHVDEGGNTYRAMYTVKLQGVVYVIDVFQKKSKRGIATPQADLDRIVKRLHNAKAHYAEYGPPETEEE